LWPHRQLPLHAFEFDVTNGNCLTESAYRVERFEVHVEGDDRDFFILKRYGLTILGKKILL